jgi:hypothetical protein
MKSPPNFARPVLKKRLINLLKPSGQNLAERGVGVDPIKRHAIGDFTI